MPVDPRLQRTSTRRRLRRGVRRRRVRLRPPAAAGRGGARAGAHEARRGHALARDAAARARHGRGVRAGARLDDVVAYARGARARGERPRRLQAPPGTDERVIEIPWVLSRLGSGRVLEVGYAFAEPAYLAALVDAAPAELVGVDLAEGRGAGLRDRRRRRARAPVPGRLLRSGAARLHARAHRRRQRASTGSTARTTRPGANRRCASCGASCAGRHAARHRAARRAGRPRLVPAGGRARLDAPLRRRGLLRRGARGVRARRGRLARGPDVRRRRESATASAAPPRRPSSAPSSARDRLRRLVIARRAEAHGAAAPRAVVPAAAGARRSRGLM